jgi:hypothetical protein
VDNVIALVFWPQDVKKHNGATYLIGDTTHPLSVIERQRFPRMFGPLILAMGLCGSDKYIFFEFIASRIPYKIFSYILCQILSSFTNKISRVQMGLSLKYQVAIQLCCLVFLLCVDCWDPTRGLMFLDPHVACPRMHPTSSDFIPWWTVYPSRWFLRCATRIMLLIRVMGADRYVEIGERVVYKWGLPVLKLVMFQETYMSELADLTRYLTDGGCQEN